MIEILRKDWEKILKKPKNYVDDVQDLAIIKITPITTPNNPTLLMVGQDVFDGRYYIVVEDNDTSEDVYLEEKDTLYKKFVEIYNDFTKKDELLTLLYEKSVEAEVEPVWQGEDGSEISLTQPVIDLINDILERAYLPFLASVIIDNGYAKKKETNNR